MSTRVPTRDIASEIAPAITRAITIATPARRGARRATTRSSKGRASSPITWSCSWPLPAITTTSPRFAASRATPMARRRSSSSTAASGACSPPTTAAAIASGASLRGLSEVTTTTSAPASAAVPMRGRLAWSRSPPAPKTTTTRASPASSRAVASTRRNPSGVCAKSTNTEKGCPATIGSSRPGTGAVAASPARMVVPSTPSCAAAVAAASAFSRLKRPESGIVTGSPSRWNASGAIEVTGSASAVEKPTVGISAASARSRPWESSRFTTARAERSGSNKRALARK